MAALPTILPASDRSLLVVLGEHMDDASREAVHRFTAAMLRTRDPFVLDLHPGVASVLVDFDPSRIRAEELSARLRACWDSSTEEPPAARLVTLPVCYETPFAPDLADVASQAGVSAREVVLLHTEASYRVLFLGFTPGFAYLGGLPAELATPRLATPRARVPAGSVAIGGAQTGAYPIESPGGWRIIGRTPVALFRPDREPAARFALGDRVRFEPISIEDFERRARDGG